MLDLSVIILAWAIGFPLWAKVAIACLLGLNLFLHFLKCVLKILSLNTHMEENNKKYIFQEEIYD